MPARRSELHLLRRFVVSTGVAAGLVGATSAFAQNEAAGRAIDTANGQVGQRKSITPSAQLDPTSRLSTRITNRIESRLRNRLDKFYNPSSNSTSSLQVAADQIKSSQRIRR